MSVALGVTAVMMAGGGLVSTFAVGLTDIAGVLGRGNGQLGNLKSCDVVMICGGLKGVAGNAGVVLVPSFCP